MKPRFLPKFPLWVDDWLSSSRVNSMTAEQEGAYLRLCLFQWRDGSLPSAIAALLRLGRLAEGDHAVLIEAFPICEDGLRRNAKVAKVRADAEAFCDERSASGRKGNATRWGRDRSAIAKGSPPSSEFRVPTPSSDSEPAPTEPEEKARKRAVPPDPIEILSEFGEIDFPEVRRALTEYVRGRAERKQRAQTPRGLRMGLRRLAAFGPSQAAQAILDATEGGWLKFYDPKPEDEPRGPRATTGRRETPGTQAVLNILARQGGVA